MSDMLKRKVWDDLLAWRQSHRGTALLVSGARQVGKTYLLRQLVEAEYASFVEVNLQAQSAIAQALSRARDADEIMSIISASATAPLQPGASAIFIDEVQAVPELVTQIKFLVQKYDYDFILSGSLLGVELHNVRSLPVGYVHPITLYPLDFEEFCWAEGVQPEVIETVRASCLAGEPILQFLYDKFLAHFRRYLVTGGMPAAVEAFVDTHDVASVRTIQRDILTLYKADISQYAPVEQRLVIQQIFGLLPAQLLRENKAFTLADIPNVRQYSRVSDEFEWLTAAGVVLRANRVLSGEKPVGLSVSPAKFKLFASDIGLLTSNFSAHVDVAVLSGQKPEMNLGGAYEIFVMQELVAHGGQPVYYSRRPIGELDLLVESSIGTVSVFEVKSGENYRTHHALTNALKADNFDIDRAVVLAETNVDQVGPVTYLPVFCVGLLSDQFL